MEKNMKNEMETSFVCSAISGVMFNSSWKEEDRVIKLLGPRPRLRRSLFARTLLLK